MEIELEPLEVETIVPLNGGFFSLIACGVSYVLVKKRKLIYDKNRVSCYARF